ncbi:hypothetical protein VIGAN_01071200 [Vigna angularis var. angularis]|uniref:Uncharacterized protein n=1 Tax=Vigna angularis var. angularis TaxID=157739 RepID=A0A0S3QY14_PHAAN|nr:hypothetical protein VIGAN_01071200 [Vigna angularis var. angularis]
MESLAKASAKPSLPTRAYDPYKDLDAPIRNLYHLPTSPEFLFVEEPAESAAHGARTSPSTPDAATWPEPLAVRAQDLLRASRPLSPGTQ